MKRTLASIVALAAFAGFAAFAAAQDKEKPKELTGFVLEQADGTFFNLCVEDNHLTIHIYDKEKKDKKPVPWNRARIQYEPNSARRQTDFMTLSDDKLTLAAPDPVKRPLSFNFWLFLFKEGSDDVALNLSGRLVQPNDADGKSASVYDMLPSEQQPNG